MSISQNFPSSRPSLNLNFARSKKLDPRITFTRTSTATYVDEDGLVKIAATDTPRFEHNPSTGESLGLLIEESRTNLTTFSEQLDNARWTVTNFTLSANTTDTTAPDGNNTAEKILETVTNGAHVFRNFNAYSITAGTVYTASIFVKSINKQFVQLVFDDNTTTNGGYVNFDLTSGTITASANYGNGSNISGSIASYSNGWYRISITTTAGTSATLARFAVNGLTSGSSGVFPGYAGNTSNGYYIWGAQLEAGAFATSYIPTVASTVTRSEDSVSITGTNFSGFYNPSEGTLFASIRNQTVRSSITYDSFVALCGSNVNNDTIRIFTQTASGGGAQNKFRFAVSVGGTDGADFGANPNGAGGPDNVGKAIIAYKTNDVAGTVSGITPATDTSVTIPTCVSLQICSAVRYQQKPTATIQQIIYYPVRLPNAQLQSLTSN